MSFNTYGQKAVDSKGGYQVWSEVNGVKHSGGIVEGFAKLPVGTVIPDGTPVHLDSAGGKLTYLKTYEIVEEVSEATAATVYAGWHKPDVGEKVMIAPDSLSDKGTAVEITKVGEVLDGKVEVTLGTAITAKPGDVLVGANDDGTIAVKPNGLLWHAIVKKDGDTVATGACVDFGRIFADRAPAIPASIEKELVTIKFDRGI